MNNKRKSAQLTSRYLGVLHKGSKASTKHHAKELRLATTEAEQKLWSLLRNRQLKEKKFRRQHAISNYVLDFYCNECRLAVELDGNLHAQAEVKEYDASRTSLLKEYGITVLRFWDHEVLSETERVLQKISDYLY